MNLHILKNQSFCQGVTKALDIVTKASTNKELPHPLYLLGNLIHNKNIDAYIASLGIIQLKGTSRLQMLEAIEEGTVIFTAHGVSNKVRERALEKKLTIIDATCPVVKKSEDMMKKYANDGYTILFIAKPSHPEALTVIDDIENSYIINPENIIIPHNLKNVAINHQTTMSGYDINYIYELIKQEYPEAIKLKVLCNITELRQKEIYDLEVAENSLIIVIGDILSNNSTKLYEQARRKTNAIFIETAKDLDLDSIKQYDDIYIASGTSTPRIVIDEVIEKIKK